MKRLVLLVLILLVSIEVSFWATAKGKSKITHAGDDLTPVAAYQMLKEDPRHTFLIDCRTMAEYEFIGHPTMAYNIPYKFWTPKERVLNSTFTQDVAARFKKTDRLIVICKTGKYSRLACEKLIKAGFKHVFNVLYGFEGDKVKDKKRIDYGHRGAINGWKHDGLPYTYELNDKLTYFPPCGCE